MGTDNFASGGFMYPNLPLLASGIGVQTPYGLNLPPGSKVAAYVRSGGVQSGDDEFLAQYLVFDLASALKRVRAGLGDTIYILPGHSESVVDATMMTNLVAGTKIIGCGYGSNMPKFRWTATTSQWAISVNDVFMSGLHLMFEGANGVVKAIAVTGANVGFFGCDIEMASGATNKATIGIEIGTGANQFQFRGNVVRGTETHNVTDGLKVVAAVTDCAITDNEMVFSATAANGLVHFTTAAALRLKIASNLLYNTMTSSVASLVFDNFAHDGIVSDNRISVKNTGATVSGTTGITFGAAALLGFHQNFVNNDPKTSGLLLPTVDT